MRLKKTNEKILIWMHRNNITQSDIASKIGITRQTWAKKMRENSFEVKDIIILKSMGFEDNE